jgi:hypothetical protein
MTYEVMLEEEDFQVVAEEWWNVDWEYHNEIQECTGGGDQLNMTRHYEVITMKSSPRAIDNPTRKRISKKSMLTV